MSTNISESAVQLLHNIRQDYHDIVGDQDGIILSIVNSSENEASLCKAFSLRYLQLVTFKDISSALSHESAPVTVSSAFDLLWNETGQADEGMTTDAVEARYIRRQIAQRTSAEHLQVFNGGARTREETINSVWSESPLGFRLEHFPTFSPDESDQHAERRIQLVKDVQDLMHNARTCYQARTEARNTGGIGPETTKAERNDLFMVMTFLQLSTSDHQGDLYTSLQMGEDELWDLMHDLDQERLAIPLPTAQ